MLFAGKTLSALKVSDVSASAIRNGRCRASAKIGGEEIWIEASEPLVPSAEAFAAIAFMPATFGHWPLEVEADLDPLFVSNLPKISQIVDRWWKHPPIAVTQSGLAEPQPRAAGKALFFTGGVDSFFSLQRRLPEVDFLINVRGFDITLDDTPRLESASKLLHKIASEAGLPLVEVTTNMREHRYFKKPNWAVTHLSAIAAIAHLLRNRISTAFVASSDVPPPWGSHQDLDPLWSSSGLTLVNDGWESGRLDKVRSLAPWRMAGDNVKVCWENNADALNCGKCEKCIRSQVQFLAAGRLDPLPSFPPGDLARDIDSIVSVNGVLQKQWTELRDALLPGAVREATEKLLGRVETVPTPPAVGRPPPERPSWTPPWR